jgi:putative ABC transport system permease protein
MIRSFLNLNELSKTVRTDNVLTANVLMPIAVYPDEASKRTAMRQLMPQLQQLPGLHAVAAATRLPLNRGSWTTRVWGAGSSYADKENPLQANYCGVTPGFFSVMSIPLRQGRDFTLEDDENGPKTCIVNESLAKAMWPGKEALGQQLRFGHQQDSIPSMTVVGVVGDVPFSAEGAQNITSGIYCPHLQSNEQSVTLVLHTQGPPAAITASLRTLLRDHHPDMPLSEIRTMPEFLKFNRWTNQIFTSLFVTFAILALVIAGVGIYGVMAYSVAQRTREIGIRMALGAAQNQVVGLVVGRAMRLTLIGSGIGLAGAFALTRLMQNMLFGVRANDPPTFAVVAVILAVSAIAAAWVPARRATRVNPIVALRYE